MNNNESSLSSYKDVASITLIVLILIAGYASYAQASQKIRYHVKIGTEEVDGLTREQAYDKILQLSNARHESAISLIIEDKEFPISPSEIDLQYNIHKAVQSAWSIGRSQRPLLGLQDLFTLPFFKISIPLTFTFSSDKLKNEISTIAQQVNVPGKDIRLFIDDKLSVNILTDTKLGFILDQQEAYNAVTQTLAHQDRETRSLVLKIIKPVVNISTAAVAQEDARQVIKEPLKLTYENQSFTIDRELLSSWIVSTARESELDFEFDEQLMSAYVASIAEELDAEPQSPTVTVVNGKVTEFIAPQTGRKLEQKQTVMNIYEALEKRKNEEVETLELALPISLEKPLIADASAEELGIVELIGTATTPFTGSPTNRRLNIKNGAKFLTGILVPPGEEFSTIKALGRIDNTTGYLPELVIKGDRTIPEFGGGLCQVSTTLFRAALNSGLPITARQNHSYRVSYYENDAEGNYIGPGLDATIYSPAPDFRFLNDTEHNMLVEGYVEGDFITFNFYGTKDGRTSDIDGPYQLSSIAAGEPIYAETDTLPPGEIRQLERAHAGGSAVATYTITYPDGETKAQEFKSYYRGWPARYIVGAETITQEESEQAEESN